ncbi:hypothetical protein [Chryseobacterium herbae]|uniref:Uncharacterized protein n=1 Tax=Chryseobacterium herbae TaxID=2976476 RepID=A0ABT2IV65_9FLAO|nr:hypothetical protein [Chryseobacterium sp. pc1-10]MCT2562734.1 hypothetical protein [Chryseobacterium sp. pc1-10]
MNKLSITIFIITGVVLSKGQVGISTSTPDQSSNLHVAPTNTSNQYKGTLLGTMSTSNRDSISQPATGLMIYNTTDNCLQVNNGTPAMPRWECLNEDPNLPFGNMIFGRYKPIYPGITGSIISVPPPQYSPTNTQLYGSYPANGNFASNDLFRIDVGRRTGDTYSAVLYNVSGERITFNYSSNAFYNPIVASNISLNNAQGRFIDGDNVTYYTEAQNCYAIVTSPAKWAGRKFLIGVNIFKEDVSNAIANGGNETGKENQSMLTYIFEFK